MAHQLHGKTQTPCEAPSRACRRPQWQQSAKATVRTEWTFCACPSRERMLFGKAQSPENAAHLRTTNGIKHGQTKHTKFGDGRTQATNSAACRWLSRRSATRSGRRRTLRKGIPTKFHWKQKSSSSWINVVAKCAAIGKTGCAGLGQGCHGRWEDPQQGEANSNEWRRKLTGIIFHT